MRLTRTLEPTNTARGDWFLCGVQNSSALDNNQLSWCEQIGVFKHARGCKPSRPAPFCGKSARICFPSAKHQQNTHWQIQKIDVQLKKKPRYRRGFLLARKVGIEPTTNRLTADRSTAELLPNTAVRARMYHGLGKNASTFAHAIIAS
jgi:hypothetical protein